MGKKIQRKKIEEIENKKMKNENVPV